MSKKELKATLSLSSVFMIRMFGLFMVLPVLALYSNTLTGSTPALIGLAIGAYGFSQALLQIPFGWLSDKWNRKSTIVLGLLIFTVGSIVAATSQAIGDVIWGRLLQGCGAISGAVIALLADLTLEKNRSKSMAFFGISIGVSFCIAMSVGPIIASYVGLSGLFWSNALLSLIAIFLVIFTVPTATYKKTDLNSKVSIKIALENLPDKQLLRLMFGVFILHFVLTSLFVFIPKILESKLHIARSQHSWVYLLIILGSFLAIIPFIIFSEKKKCLKECFIFAIFLIIIAFVAITLTNLYPPILYIALIFFFSGFNFLEATLPSLVSKLSKAGSRGSIMGIFSTCQFLGAACGGTFSGITYQYFNLNNVMLCSISLLCVWLIFAFSMKQPPYLSSIVMSLNIKNNSTPSIEKLFSIEGVEDVIILEKESTAYLKVDRQKLDTNLLETYGKF